MLAPVNLAGLTGLRPVLPASVTICTCNRPDFLTDTVDSILHGSSLPAEIVIVDQSAIPHPVLGALSGRDGCAIRYMRSDSRGVSAARNLAIAVARQEVIVSTDDDVLVTPKWLETIYDALHAAGRRCVVTGQVRPTDPEKPGAFAPSLEMQDQPAVYEGRIGKDVFHTANVAYYRLAVQEVGWFDERLGAGAHFPAAYDNDFGLRLLEAGYRILYLPAAVLYHRAWRTEKDYIPLRWNYGRGQGAFYAKHIHLRDRYMLGRMTHLVTGHLRELARNLPHSRRAAFGHAMYVLGFLSGATEWLLTQRIRNASGERIGGAIRVNP